MYIPITACSYVYMHMYMRMIGGIGGPLPITACRRASGVAQPAQAGRGKASWIRFG